jgi:hypothetical protein
MAKYGLKLRTVCCFAALVLGGAALSRGDSWGVATPGMDVRAGTGTISTL